MPMRAHSVAACRPSASPASREDLPIATAPQPQTLHDKPDQTQADASRPVWHGRDLSYGADRTNRSGGVGLPFWSRPSKKNPASAGLFSFNSAAGATPASRVHRERGREQRRADDDFLEIAHGTFAKVDGTSGIIVLIASRQYPSNTPPVGINA